MRRKYFACKWADVWTLQMFVFQIPVLHQHAGTRAHRRHAQVRTCVYAWERQKTPNKKNPTDFEANVFWVFSHIWIKISFQLALRFHKNASLTAIILLVSSSMDSRLDFLKSFQEESVFCCRFNIFIWVHVYFSNIIWTPWCMRN